MYGLFLLHFLLSFLALISAHIGCFIFVHERILGKKLSSRSLSPTLLSPNSPSAGGKVGRSRSMRRRTRTGRRNWLSLLFRGGGVFLILVFLVCFPLPLISFLASQRKSDEICIPLYVSNQYRSLFIFSSWISSPHGGGSEGKAS